MRSSSGNYLTLAGSDLIGCTVRNRLDDKLGKIDDLVIDTQSGAVAYAVLSVSDGFLGLDRKYFAIPLESFEFNTNDDYLLLNIDKDRLENAPGFEYDKNNLSNHPQNEFVESLYSHYGYRPFYNRFTR